MKKYKITFWVTTVFLFLFEGIMPLSTVLFAPQFVTAGTGPLGYPAYFAYLLIAFKVMGAVILILPGLPRQIKEWAYAGFAFNFIFATVSHVAVTGLEPVSFFPLIIFAIMVLSYISYFRIYPDTERSRYLRTSM